MFQFEQMSGHPIPSVSAALTLLLLLTVLSFSNTNLASVKKID